MSRERCVALVRDGMGLPDLEVAIVDAQPWDAASGMARAYRSGRVLIAGDAAHQMTPYLGLGAGTGIEDAYNLAWKLALVSRGVADDGLLDTYEAERMPVARKAVLDSAQAADENGLPRLGQSMPQDVRALVGLDFAYGSRAIVRDEALDPADEGQPGRRVPHVWLRSRDGSRVSTLDLAPGEFAVLAGPDGLAWRDALEGLTEVVAPRFFCIGSPNLVDESEQWSTHAGLEREGALLVRPDRVVAWRSRGSTTDAAARLRGVLGRILGPPG